MKEYIADGWRVVDWFAYCPILQRGDEVVIFDEEQAKVVLRFNMTDRETFDLIQQVVATAVLANKQTTDEKFAHISTMLTHIVKDVGEIKDDFSKMNGSLKATIKEVGEIKHKCQTHHVTCPNALVIAKCEEDVKKLKDNESRSLLITATRTEMKNDFKKILIWAASVLAVVTGVASHLSEIYNLIIKIF